MKRLLLGLCVALSVVACGKKGNPLPPLQRIPAAPADFSVVRLHDQIYVRFIVPSTNVDGVSPGDVARVELYGLTVEGPPTLFGGIEQDELRELATLVASEPVRAPVPPPPVVDGARQIPMPPRPPGVDQGMEVVVREALTPEISSPRSLPMQAEPIEQSSANVPRGLAAPPAGASLQRYYFAVSVSSRGRYGPPTALVPAPLAPTVGAPSNLEIDVTERSMTIKWTPPADARGQAAPELPDVLPSRPLAAAPAATTYDVYEVSRSTPPDGPSVLPAPLTAEPIAATEFTQQDVTFGTERCFYVRAVEVVDGVHVRGPASPVACASFADVFPPAAPGDLVAVAVPGAVNLLWEPSPASDVVGYLVLRAEAGSATLTPLMTTPVTAPSYRDASATTGVRYVYAVVAVDGAGNRSTESNRVEETAQ